MVIARLARYASVFVKGRPVKMGISRAKLRCEV